MSWNDQRRMLRETLDEIFDTVDEIRLTTRMAIYIHKIGRAVLALSLGQLSSASR